MFDFFKIVSDYFYDAVLSTEIEKGDYVMWVSQGIEQWDKYKKVSHIEEYDGQHYIFVVGSLTGYPEKDLIKK